MKSSKSVIVFRSLTIGVVILFLTTVILQWKNKRLIEQNNLLLLQNDSVLSVNLQLQEDLNLMKVHLDSISRNDPTRLTAGK